MDKLNKVTSRIIIVLIVCMSLVPFYVMIIGSLKGNQALLRIPPDILPFNFIIDNFKKMVEINFFRYFRNSIIISCGTIVATLFVATTAGYSFAKKKFFGKNVLFIILLSTMMIPRQIIMIPTFILLEKIGLSNNFLGLILPAASMPFAVFLLKQFMQTIPDEILDAARIDGASEIRVFTGVILPLSKAPISALTIIVLVGSWNDYFWQLVIIRSNKLYPLPIALASLMQEENLLIGYQLAGAFIATVPILIVFVILQKYFLEGVTIGAIKG